MAKKKKKEKKKKKKQKKIKDMTWGECWKWCLAMWKWISEEQPESKEGWDDDRLAVIVELKDKWLKDKWLEEHGFTGKDRPLEGCFFCEWNDQSGNSYNCNNCPGNIVDKNKFSCTDYDWDYSCFPRKFYRKLLRLDKRRREKGIRGRRRKEKTGQ